MASRQPTLKQLINKAEELVHKQESDPRLAQELRGRLITELGLKTLDPKMTKGMLLARSIDGIVEQVDKEEKPTIELFRPAKLQAEGNYPISLESYTAAQYQAPQFTILGIMFKTVNNTEEKNIVTWNNHEQIDVYGGIFKQAGGPKIKKDFYNLMSKSLGRSKGKFMYLHKAKKADLMQIRRTGKEAIMLNFDPIELLDDQVQSHYKEIVQHIITYASEKSIRRTA